MEIHQQDAKLYLDCNVLSPYNEFKAETQVVALLSAYCRTLNLDVIMITNSPTISHEKQTFVFPKSCFKSVTAQRFHDVPSMVQVCQLPAVVTSDEVNIFSGLSTVLRYIVKRACGLAKSKQERNELIRLLGHRLYCLKACSEVSPRTKLCEVTAPSVINNWSDEDGGVFSDKTSSMPRGILEFESLLSQPVVMHNMDKRQRLLLQNLKRKRLEGNGTDRNESYAKGKEQKTVVWTKDLPQLQHTYAEGVDFTLTDICLLPCVHFYLVRVKQTVYERKGVIPLILQWYSRLQRIERLKQAFNDCGMSFVDGCGDAVDPSKPLNEMQLLELHKLPKCDVNEMEEKSRQKDAEMTIRRDLPKLLEKLTRGNVSVKFTEYDIDAIRIDWPSLPREIHPTEGELTALRADRKCHQIENLVRAVKTVTKDGNTIVDFCSGGGHVGIVLAHLLPSCHIILVENKEESLERARIRISKLDLKNISIYQCNLDYYRGTFDVGVALHACGVASDMVIQRCVSKRASFVVSPCCYGRVRNCDWITFPQSKRYKEMDISLEEHILLGHAADQTTWKFESEKAKQGKLCMGYIDFDRASAAREKDYDVTIHTLVPHTCSPKNNLLVGVAR